LAYAVGVALILICVVTSLALALEHITGLSLPGCGEGSPCAQAAASVWGKIPYLNWPASYVGVAYFLAVLAAWLGIRRGSARGLRYVVRFGVLISLGFVAIMLVEQYVCSYCLLTHIANFLFWIMLEWSPRAVPRGVRVAVLPMVVFIVATAALGATEWRTREKVEAKAEAELAESLDELTSLASRPTALAKPVAEPVAEPGTQSIVDPNATAPGEETASATSAPSEEGPGFTGRYRLGPEKAAIRIVMITDYQCKECKRIEADVFRLLDQRDDMSLSFKQYPMNSDCNRSATGQPHPNACWAARAAEAAGILRGDAGFWKMHHWLFNRGGGFTREELRAGLRELGYDIVEFERVMQGDETLALVETDVEEAIGLGVWYTPTIFINGVELRGWNAKNAVERAVERLAATNPAALTAAADHPPPAVEKLVGDWLAEPRRAIPPGEPFQSTGSDNPSVRIVLFGDYRQQGTLDLDRVIQGEIASRRDIHYEFRCFPFEMGCNPAVKRETKYIGSCRAAQAARAAGLLGGADGFWKMHDWLFENQERFDAAALRQAAGSLGFNADELLAEMDKPEVRTAVVEEAKFGQRMRVTVVPTIFINGRRVPKWTAHDEIILPRIIAEAAER
jgi:protein-disulfide isomerase/uncharacterized membrane protein